MQRLGIPTSYEETIREKMYIICISPSHHQTTIYEFHRFENYCYKNLRLKFLKRIIHRCMWWSFVIWWFLSLYLKMGANLIESFLVLGPHYNNVIGAKNKICNIECSYLHHIFDYHCDYGELFKTLSCWTLSNFLWNFVAFVTLGVVVITNVSSKNLIMDKSKSTMFPMNMWFVATPM